MSQFTDMSGVPDRNPSPTFLRVKPENRQTATPPISAQIHSNTSPFDALNSSLTNILRSVISEEQMEKGFVSRIIGKPLDKYSYSMPSHSSLLKLWKGQEWWDRLASVEQQGVREKFINAERTAQSIPTMRREMLELCLTQNAPTTPRHLVRCVEYRLSDFQVSISSSTDGYEVKLHRPENSEGNKIRTFFCERSSFHSSGAAEYDRKDPDSIKNVNYEALRVDLVLRYLLGRPEHSRELYNDWTIGRFSTLLNWKEFTPERNVARSICLNTSGIAGITGAPTIEDMSYLAKGFRSIDAESICGRYWWFSIKPYDERATLNMLQGGSPDSIVNSLTSLHFRPLSSTKYSKESIFYRVQTSIFHFRLLEMCGAFDDQYRVDPQIKDLSINLALNQALQSFRKFYDVSHDIVRTPFYTLDDKFYELRASLF